MVGEWWARADGIAWRGRDGVEEPIMIGGISCALRLDYVFLSLSCTLAVARAAHGHS